MDLTDTNTAATVLCAAALAVGIIGVVVPVLPGLALCWAGVLVWAVLAGDAGPGRWVVLAAATVIIGAGAVVKYAWPGRNLKRAGVPNRTLAAGGVLGLIGFFVIPVVGLVLGFVAGVFLAESLRLRNSRMAWPSTRSAVAAAGLSMMVEMGSGLTTAAVWVAGLILLT